MEVVLVRQIAVPLLLAVLATALFTPLLLLRYRSRVAALMARRLGEQPAPQPAALPPQAELPAAPELLARSTASVRLRARAWFLGFALQAALLTLLFALRFADGLGPVALLLALLVFLLPAGLVLLSVSAASGWIRLLAVAAGALLLMLWPGVAGDLLRSSAQLYVALPLAPLLLFHLRFWRGAAPLVFLLALLGFGGWVLAMGLATGLFGVAPGAGLWLWRLLGLAAGLLLGLWVLRRVAERHRRGTLSDQALSLEVWWLLYTLVQASVLSIGLGSAAAVAVLVSFALGRWCAGRGVRQADVPAPQRLLLLRVFGNSRRSERLFEQLVQAWTPLGSIELIGGVDLALQQVSPQDFLAFLSGRLADRFGQAPAEAAARLAAPIRPAADGCYPARQTFCHADAWEPAMRRLLQASDAVVMDLRQFRAERSGCRTEIAALARSAAQRPIVLVTDASTDQPLLRRLLAENGADPDRPPWRIVTAGHREAATVARVIEAIGSSG